MASSLIPSFGPKNNTHGVPHKDTHMANDDYYPDPQNEQREVEARLLARAAGLATPRPNTSDLESAHPMSEMGQKRIYKRLYPPKGQLTTH